MVQEMLIFKKIIKWCLLGLTKVQCYYNSTDALKLVSSDKLIFKVVYRSAKKWEVINFCVRFY